VTKTRPVDSTAEGTFRWNLCKGVTVWNEGKVPSGVTWRVRWDHRQEAIRKWEFFVISKLETQRTG
jgi:hypothetical protein